MVIEMLDKLPEPNRSACIRLYGENRQRLMTARGSTHNHQTWNGGYFDHVQEVMNYAVLFYGAEASTGRPIPFTLEDALLALFLHDLEKPWRFELVDGEWRNSGTMKSKADRAAFRWAKIAEYGIVLSPEVENAVRYAEGEGDDYRPDRRVSNELAGFVHMMDTHSARVRHDYPKHGDPWTGMITLAETENEA
jgi:hypothetical protein